MLLMYVSITLSLSLSIFQSSFLSSFKTLMPNRLLRRQQCLINLQYSIVNINGNDSLIFFFYD
ncbi:hypothetical protein HanXRQr2_Chr05g0193271 [Helianthus annuus]|uniref:Uncharacterized protein n=1 Tax=Helianthus annuus TaxID=4232 RepID=A0A9K3IY16_HELAN|nr:hypothetical protein HanXRQr2_Chr05g0193271 [Helianthus annuus]